MNITPKDLDSLLSAKLNYDEIKSGNEPFEKYFIDFISYLIDKGILETDFKFKKKLFEYIKYSDFLDTEENLNRTLNMYMDNTDYKKFFKQAVKYLEEHNPNVKSFSNGLLVSNAIYFHALDIYNKIKKQSETDF